MRAVQRLDRLVHEVLQPLPGLVDAFDSRTVLVDVRQRHPRRGGARQDLLRLGTHLAEQSVVLGPAVRVCLVEVQVGAVEVARHTGVPLASHHVGRALDGGRVHIPHPVAQRHHRAGRRLRRRVEIGPQRPRSLRRELLEPAGTAVDARPLRELLDERGRRPRRTEQLALQAEFEGGAVALVRGGHRPQPLGDRRPVLVRLHRRQGEDLAHRVRARVQIADGTQALVGVVHGQLRRQPLAQQPRAAPLDVGVGARPRLRLVEPRQRVARERREGVQAGGREVGELAAALPDAEFGADDGVQGDELVDVRVGDLAGQRRRGRGRGGDLRV